MADDKGLFAPFLDAFQNSVKVSVLPEGLTNFITNLDDELQARGFSHEIRAALIVEALKVLGKGQ